MKKWIKEISSIAESLDWSVSVEKNEFTFGKYSPAGQDFSFSITANTKEEAIKEVWKQYDDFDISEETYIWLDSTGHGANGAPYDMKDVYEDMETCRDMIDKLYTTLSA